MGNLGSKTYLWQQKVPRKSRVTFHRCSLLPGQLEACRSDPQLASQNERTRPGCFPITAGNSPAELSEIRVRSNRCCCAESKRAAAFAVTGLGLKEVFGRPVAEKSHDHGDSGRPARHQRRLQS